MGDDEANNGLLKEVDVDSSDHVTTYGILSARVWQLLGLAAGKTDKIASNAIHIAVRLSRMAKVVMVSGGNDEAAGLEYSSWLMKWLAQANKVTMTRDYGRPPISVVKCRASLVALVIDNAVSSLTECDGFMARNGLINSEAPVKKALSLFLGHSQVQSSSYSVGDTHSDFAKRIVMRGVSTSQVYVGLAKNDKGQWYVTKDGDVITGQSLEEINGQFVASDGQNHHFFHVADVHNCYLSGFPCFVKVYYFLTKPLQEGRYISTNSDPFLSAMDKLISLNGAYHGQ